MKHLRRCPRTKIKLQKTIPVKMKKADGEVLHRYVRLIDLSEGGLKLSGDLAPPDEPFELELNTQVLSRDKSLDLPQLHLKVENRWQKSLYGDMWVGGFAFTELTPEQMEAVKTIISHHNENPTPAKISESTVSLGIVTKRGTAWYYPLITRLDLEVIEFQSTEELLLDDTSKLVLSFRETGTLVEASASLVWRRALDSTFRYCLSFKDLTPEAMMAIQQCSLQRRDTQPAA